MKRICNTMNCYALLIALAALSSASFIVAQSQPTAKAGVQYQPVEWAYLSQHAYADPYNQVDLDVVFTSQDGETWRVPAFWAGGNEWHVRFAPPLAGDYKFHAESTDKNNPDLNGHDGTLHVDPYKGSNPLLKHGTLGVSANKRTFEYPDGTHFLWLGDTWWDGLCTRISLDEFKTLADDRKAKGFDVIQIVAGLNPDEPPFDPRSMNEGGMPYEPNFARINPKYFDAADKRFQALVDDGLTPAIVGSWGYYLPWMGIDKAKKHWRNLVARYSAYPVVWIMTGEQTMPYYMSEHSSSDSNSQHEGWTEVAKYLRSIDPYQHLITTHPSTGKDSRDEMTDPAAVDFDMLQTGHHYWESAADTVGWLSEDYSRTPATPVVIGEADYEGHQQTNWSDIQRFILWTTMLNGGAGFTYGAGGIWETNGKTVHHGPSPWGITYENTPWNVAMQLPGSTEVGLGKKILSEYPWWNFTPHPDWVSPHGTSFLEPHSEKFNIRKRWTDEKGNYLLPYAAGIPGETRVIYIPTTVYHPRGPLLTDIEENVIYRATYIDPINGDKTDLGTLVHPTLTPLVEDKFSSSNKMSLNDANSKWTLLDTQPMIDSGALVADDSTWMTRKDVNEADVQVSVDALSNATAGILLRFHDRDNAILAVYSAVNKQVWIEDVRGGKYGNHLGGSGVGEIGKTIHLVAEVHGANASLTITDGTHIYRTGPAPVENLTAGQTGLWTGTAPCEGYPGECRYPRVLDTSVQSFSNFTVSRIAPVPASANANIVELGSWNAPNLPLSQDWVLVLNREQQK